MTRFLSTSLLLTVCLAGCSGPDRYANCEWPTEESDLALDLQNPRQRRHLSDDALAAEDLAIRYADYHRGHRSGHFEGAGEYARTRDQCMAALFGVIGSRHHLTPAQVREALGRRRVSLDAAVIGSFAVLYGFASGGVVGWIFRRVSGDAWPALVAAVLASAGAGVAGVGLFEIWSGLMEMIRVGNTHMSYRVSRAPWAGHRPELFVAGVVLFWLIAVLRYRITIRDDGNQCPNTIGHAV